MYQKKSWLSGKQREKHIEMFAAVPTAWAAARIRESTETLFVMPPKKCYFPQSVVTTPFKQTQSPLLLTRFTEEPFLIPDNAELFGHFRLLREYILKITRMT
jgi:hypothetical protein